MVPPEPRLPGARELIDQAQYFVVHAPRQTGKTTTLGALARDVAADGRQVALLFSCERAQPTGDDYAAAAGEILEAITEEAVARGLPAELMPPSPWPDASPGSRLHAGLAAWARQCPLPIALIFDEIDSVRGQSLISVLWQLRDGFRNRPHSFPASAVLCGLRDVRDYTAASGAIRIGYGPQAHSTSPLSHCGSATSPGIRWQNCTDSTLPIPDRNLRPRRLTGHSTTRKGSRGWSTPWLVRSS